MMRNIKDISLDNKCYKFVKNGDIDGVKSMLSNGYDINRMFNNGLCALYISVLYSKLNMCKYLLENGADINSVVLQNGIKRIVFCYVISKKSINLFKLFMKYKPNLNLLDDYNMISLDYAFNIDSKYMIIELIKNGADVLSKNYFGINNFKKPIMRDNDIQYNILKYCPESFKLLKEYSYITKKTKNNPEFDYLFDCDNLGLI